MSRPAQQQEPPGYTSEMRPRPRDSMDDYEGTGLLRDRRALITGGDSGIGRAVAVAFAKEGADVAIAYLEEHTDAEKTAELVEAQHRRCVLLPGDLASARHCAEVVDQTVLALGGLDVLVNNAATQTPVDRPEEITDEQWLHTFDVNMHSYFRVTTAALAHLGESDAIVNCASVNGLRGHKKLIDYSATKGAIVAFTRSLSLSLAERGIRVNAVAPGPVWTPLIPSTFDAEHVSEFGGNVPLGRPGQPAEIAPSYVFLASDDASFITGQVVHPNGGSVVNG